MVRTRWLSFFFILRFLRQRLLNRLARQHLVAHGCVVDKAGDDYADLFQIVGLQAIIHIHIRVVGARLILDRILNELESRNADGIEGLMVGAAGVAHGDGIHAEIFERFHPGLENWLYGGILLQVNAANFSTAVVHVEIGGDFRLFWFHRDFSGFAAQKCRHVFHPGLVHARTRTEMLLHITLRAQQTFFLTAPEAAAAAATEAEAAR